MKGLSFALQKSNFPCFLEGVPHCCRLEPHLHRKGQSGLGFSVGILPNEHGGPELHRPSLEPNVFGSGALFDDSGSGDVLHHHDHDEIMMTA